MKGYRKVAVALVGIVVGGALSYLGKLDTPTATLIGSIVTGYLSANVTKGVLAK
jgi:hypothetical protein